VRELLIIQNKIPHYRKAFYNQLSEEYNVTIIHSGKLSKNNSDQYNEILAKCLNIGPFYFQSRVLKEIKNKKYYAVIVMADLRWIFNVLSIYIINKKIKLIFWGQWLTEKWIIDTVKIHFTKKNKVNILYSENIKKQFIKVGVPSGNLFVANNTIDVGRRPKCFNYRDKFRILFVGSLVARKELGVLITAFSNIIECIPDNIILTIVGDGPEMSNLKNFSKELGLRGRLIFSGELNKPRQLHNFYKEAIVSVSYGQAGLSVLQSFGFGVAFITKRNAISGGEIHNIIDGHNGFKIRGGDHNLQECLKTIVLNLNYARHLGKNAYLYYSKHCTISNMVNSFRLAINSNDLSMKKLES
jgi:glycosyltransferase involved in cell wall biosynthesis